MRLKRHESPRATLRLVISASMAARSGLFRRGIALKRPDPEKRIIIEQLGMIIAALHGKRGLMAWYLRACGLGISCGTPPPFSALMNFGHNDGIDEPEPSD